MKILLFKTVSLFPALLDKYENNPSAHIYYKYRLEDDHDNLIKFSDMPKEFGGSGEIIEYKYIY